jgi:hypothetical protein
MVVLVLLGVIWGAWLGRREAAHIGVGIGSLGLIAGAALGTGIGFGLSFTAWWVAVLTVAVLGGGTAVIVRRW